VEQRDGGDGLLYMTATKDWEQMRRHEESRIVVTPGYCLLPLFS